MCTGAPAAAAAAAAAAAGDGAGSLPRTDSIDRVARRILLLF